MTDMKCSLRFLGWDNRTKRRESIWRDTQGNYLLFTDTQMVLGLTTNNSIKKYPNVGTDLTEIMNQIMDTVSNGQEPISSNTKNA